MTPTVLLTGATGYIASHTWLALQAAGFAVVGVDDFSNSSPAVLGRLRELSGAEPVFERANVCDAQAVERIFERHRIDAAVHFAAFKAVGESVARAAGLLRQQPRRHAHGVRARCSAHGVRRFVFSSSATVYGEPERAADRARTRALSATNPYGQTKLMGEQILRDLGAVRPRLADAPACATSTRWARTRAAASARTRAACPTT